MCGICGIIDFRIHRSTKARSLTVHQMNEAMYHRGPDEAGKFDDDICSLAMRRLAIIDINGGAQPIFNETKDILVFLNGEIYNYRDLRKRLLENGHKFRTESDTEVIVHLYEDFGSDCFSMLQGQFSICLYDLRNQTYLIARDRFGEKPCYYYQGEDFFAFSSEIKSLITNPDIDRRLNHAALPYYFRTSLVPDPMTMFDGIHSILPGHYLQIHHGKVEEHAYFKLIYKTPEIDSEEEAIEALTPVFEAAVKKQMVSDVPIAAFLSGGIDSSSIVAVMQKLSTDPIKTFHVRFDQPGYDESAVARQVAKSLGTDHHELTIPNFDFDESIFWTVIDHIGIPFRDSSAIPTFLISREISKHSKVALSGDGGDELFGGYDLFQWYQKVSRARQYPLWTRKALNQGLGLISSLPSLPKQSRIRQIKRGLDTSFLFDDDIPIALNAFFQADFMPGELTRLKIYPEKIPDASLRKIMYYRMKHTLPGNMLIKVDRMSMANSLEVRAPFLDPDLFDLSMNLCDDLLIRNGKGKAIMRRLMKPHLPAEVFDHPKSGFNLPLHQFQNANYEKLAHRLLFEENPFPELFSTDVLKSIYQDGVNTKHHTAQKSVFQTSHQLWMMMQLFGWAKHFNVKY